MIIFVRHNQLSYRLAPLVHLGVRAGPQRRQGHLCVSVSQEVCSVRVVVLHLKKGYNWCGVGGAILLQIDKQRVRVFKLTLCSIAKFELLVMQYEHNMKAPAALVFYAC